MSIGWALIGDLSFYATTYITVGFTAMYLLLAPWWRSLDGRSIATFMVAMSLTFSYFSWAIHSGGIPDGFHGMRAALFALIGASVGWRTVIFIRQHLIPSLRGELSDQMAEERKDLDGAPGRSDHGSDRGLS